MSAFVVHFKSALYTGPQLAQHEGLAYLSPQKWTGTLYVYDDARKAKLVLDEFPYEALDLVVHGRFSQTPMSLEMRALTANLARRLSLKGRFGELSLLQGVYEGLGKLAAKDTASADLLRLEGSAALTRTYEGEHLLESDIDLEALQACTAEILAEDALSQDDEEGARSHEIEPSTSSPVAPDKNDPLGLLES